MKRSAYEMGVLYLRGKQDFTCEEKNDWYIYKGVGIVIECRRIVSHIIRRGEDIL